MNTKNEGIHTNQVITIRNVSINDADLLLAWRNDPETRAASHNQNLIKQKDHLTWLANSLGNNNRRLYIAELGDEAIGSLRADLEDGVWELSWTLSAQARGRGLAKKMVALLVDTLAQEKAGAIRAEVKEGNIASAKIAEHVGMCIEKQKNGVIFYKKV